MVYVMSWMWSLAAQLFCRWQPERQQHHPPLTLSMCALPISRSQLIVWMWISCVFPQSVCCSSTLLSPSLNDEHITGKLLWLPLVMCPWPLWPLGVWSLGEEEQENHYKRCMCLCVCVCKTGDFLYCFPIVVDDVIVTIDTVTSVTVFSRT